MNLTTLVRLTILIVLTVVVSCSTTNTSTVGSQNTQQLSELGLYSVQTDTLYGQLEEDSTITVFLTKGDRVTLLDSTSSNDRYLVRYGVTKMRVIKTGLSRVTSTTQETKSVKKEVVQPTRTIYTGPRGGRYYYDDNGKKVYLPK